MSKPRYQVYVDSRLAYQGNHLKLLKQQAQFEIDYCNAFYVRIMRGKKVYATKKYDEKEWHRWG